MMPAATPRACSPRQDGAFSTVLLVVLLAVTSCGRTLPTAPSVTTTPARASVGAAASGSEPDEVVVTLAPGVGAETVAASYEATVIWDDGGGHAEFAPRPGETADQLVLRMITDPRLVTRERNVTLETSESRTQEPYATDDGHGTSESYAQQPAAAAIHLQEAHVVSRGEGVRIAILDTGADTGHPALSDRIVGGWDFISNDADPSDRPDGLDNDGDGAIDEAVGHGTHVAGIAALTAPRAELLIVRVLDSDGRGDVMSVASGIRWALDHGARVINLSLGMLKNSDAIQHLIEGAEDRGVVMVASAGNWGAEDPREFPAASSHSLAVAAANTNATPAFFTSFGSHVALSAPGVGVRSAFPGGGYRLWGGTSMAAPFVAGTAALLLALHPEWHQEQVMDRIGAAARPLVAVPPGLQGRLGAGMLDVAAALAADRRGSTDPDDPPEGDSAPLLRRP